MENKSIIQKSLKNSTLFHNIPDAAIADLSEKALVESYVPSQIIFEENTQGDNLYIIDEGTIKISKKSKYNLESTIGILHPGDFFGELELIDELPRSATTTAISNTKLLKFTKNDFRNILKTYPQVIQNIMITLTLRLRSTDDTFIREIERHTENMNNQMERLHHLIEATKIVNSTLDLDKLLKLILDIAVQTIKADRGTLYLIDAKKNELISKVIQGDELIEIRLPIGKGIAGKVAEKGSTINIVNAYKDERFNPEIDKMSGYNTESILCMPMKNKDGKILGVFQLLNKQKGTFTKQDEEYIEAYSVHAAISLENASLARQMVQDERLSAVGRMASTIIHDIKNPMSTIRLYAQILKTKSGNEEASMMADQIMMQIDRFVSMAQQILDFSKGVSDLQLQEIEIGEILGETITFLERDFAKRRIEIEKSIEYTGKFILDLDKMTRVFYNIAGNAADAMPTGGVLQVRTYKDSDVLNIEFVDNGIGMTDIVKAKIFEPFFTSGKKHGTGLGMAIVKKIIDDHKGKIEIDSEPGKGTTMRIKLPFQK
jgi:K+-sensing histidine kinase KdpD